MFKRQLVNNVRLYDSKNSIKGAAFSVDVQVDRFGKIKAEDTHDRFCIDHICFHCENLPISIITVTVNSNVIMSFILNVTLQKVKKNKKIEV